MGFAALLPDSECSALHQFSHLAERYEIAGVEGTATFLAIVEKLTMKHLYLFVRWQERKAVIWG